MLIFALTDITPLYGCAAGQVMVSSSEFENTNCASLINGLEIAQESLQKLESIDATERDAETSCWDLACSSFHLLESSTPLCF